MTLEKDLEKIGDIGVGVMTYDLGDNGIRDSGFLIKGGLFRDASDKEIGHATILVTGCISISGLYIDENVKRIVTLRDCLEYFCPKTPRNMGEFHDMLLNAFGPNRNDELREILSRSLSVV